MNLFLLADIISLAILLIITVLFISFKNYEDSKFHPAINSMLFGLFFIMIYLIFNVIAFLMSYYAYKNTAVVYSANLIVIPLAAIFFFVSTLLSSE